MWDKDILTDLTVAANRPEIVYCDRNKKTLLIDVACPCDSNVALEHTEKLTKHRLLIGLRLLCSKLLPIIFLEFPKIFTYYSFVLSLLFQLVLEIQTSN